MRGHAGVGQAGCGCLRRCLGRVGARRMLSAIDPGEPPPFMGGRALYDTARLTVTHAMAIAASPISAIGQITWMATETGMSCRNTPRAITSM